jgi:peroxiredoxin
LRQTIGQRVEVALIRKHILEEVMEEYRDKIADEYRLMIRANVVAAIYNDAARFFFKEDLTDPEIIRLYEEQLRPAFPLADGLTPELILSGDAHRKVLQDMALLDYLISHKISYTKEYKTDKKRLFDFLREAYALKAVNDWLLAGFIVDRAKHDGWDNELEACVMDYYLGAPEGRYYEQVRHIRQQAKLMLGGDVPAYDFSLPDKGGETIRLRDFQGKVVLIDFNFYGCVGCKLMVPALETLEHHFAGNDKVAFISISTDRSEERFIKSIGTFSSPGSVHLYTGGEGIEHPVVKAYDIASYPTLVLIDPQGRIITARAPDPRSVEGMRELTALIRSAM